MVLKGKDGLKIISPLINSKALFVTSCQQNWPNSSKIRIKLSFCQNRGRSRGKAGQVKCVLEWPCWDALRNKHISPTVKKLLRHICDSNFNRYYVTAETRMFKKEWNPFKKGDTASLTSAKVHGGSQYRPQSLTKSNACIIAKESHRGSKLCSTVSYGAIQNGICCLARGWDEGYWYPKLQPCGKLLAFLWPPCSSSSSDESAA